MLFFFGLWVHALFSLLSFVISTSVNDCLGRFVPEMTYYVLSGTLNLTKLKLCGSLPAALRRPEMTLHTFKRQLKTYLFQI